MQRIQRAWNSAAANPVDAAQRIIAVSKTIAWAELEEWQKDNEYILEGYRRTQNSWKDTFHSVFAYVHNETVNIHSHLWGAVLFVYLIVTFPSYIRRFPEATWIDVAVACVFLSSAVFCLSASAFYHAASSHSYSVARRCHALDYSGVVVLTVGSFYPSLYYGFYGDARMQAAYISGITLIGIGAAYVVLSPEYSKPTHRGTRTSVFIALGLCAVVPVAHWFFTHGASTLLLDMGYGWLVASGALYIAGALIYANRIPERYSPGTFDYYLSSHQIFHVCVVLAALAHLAGVRKSIEYTYAGRLHRGM
ncbi:hemolysin-III related-domain-containing protein [Schizophyllum amplum]|uniref:Hemolysin-III related-domain-containing protein n=1 Tax=Schizophyllum amplum TaxID=97359 RepID=A0A550CFI9_9AGAR|nr:hemolysin-III related-domain-containing protein [Auriculariopsis ampla]